MIGSVKSLHIALSLAAALAAVACDRFETSAADAGSAVGAAEGPPAGASPDPPAGKATDPGERGGPHGPVTAERRAVYVPVYSHIYFGDQRNQFDLTVTLSVRNTDPAYPLLVTSVRYLDSDGELVRTYVDEPARLGPMASLDFFVGERDRTGGIGANFVVEWIADDRLVEPVIEAVMIGTRSGQGISFTSVARPTRPSVPAADTASRPD